MQHDQIIWEVINNQFCSFKAKIAKEKTFCRNEYNVTGLCNRSSCPLANSKYATIREHDGRIYLYLKTVERAHTPKDLWERIRLSRDYGKAMAQLDEHLEFFSKHLVHRNKQRLTKIHQYLIRMRKLELKVKPKLVGVMKKVERREDRREVKALKAAKLDESIQSELLSRLSKGTYGDIYNFPETPYNKALSEKVMEEGIEEFEDLEERELEEEELIEYVEDFDEDDEEWGEEEEDLEDMGGDSSDDDEDEGGEGGDDDGDIGEGMSSGDDDDNFGKKKKGKRKKGGKEGKEGGKKKGRKGERVEIEYEIEDEEEQDMIDIGGDDW
ncbi:hypothetical protein TrCOL_g37 [Triparma columacea]|uniref:Protein MAK16 homolog n=1 Tax=Triparma columacea TaxID=722753 RepID=A0A9W7FXS2_9STRA|nr:hypothetical protein TrCOL_g37 [Triparma columacea]